MKHGENMISEFMYVYDRICICIHLDFSGKNP